MGERKMMDNAKHYTTEEWVDYVNEVASKPARKAMEKHLETGCKSCTKAAALWGKVRKAAEAEGSYQPPADALRNVTAAFSGAGVAIKPKKTQGFVEVLFDSFLQPAMAGARSAAAASRHMLYRADPYQLDIQIEAKWDVNHLVVTGQLLDINHPEVTGREVQITVSNRRGHVVHTVTNGFGEFHVEIDHSGDLELSLPGRGEKPVVISLRNALGQLGDKK